MSLGHSKSSSEFNQQKPVYKSGTLIPTTSFTEKDIMIESGMIKVCDKSGVLIFRILPGEVLDKEFAAELNIENGNTVLEAETDVQIKLIECEKEKQNPEDYLIWLKTVNESRRGIFKRVAGSACTTNACMEIQIVQYLKHLTELTGSKEITITHAVIAKDLGSVREVVSRALKKLEKSGQVELKRGRIIVR